MVASPVPSVLSSERITHCGTQPCPVPSQVDGVYMLGKAAHLCWQNRVESAANNVRCEDRKDVPFKVAGHRRQQETGSYDMQTTKLAQLAFLI